MFIQILDLILMRIPEKVGRKGDFLLDGCSIGLVREDSQETVAG